VDRVTPRPCLGGEHRGHIIVTASVNEAVEYVVTLIADSLFDKGWPEGMIAWNYQCMDFMSSKR
jgi:hypothetical protein